MGSSGVGESRSLTAERRRAPRYPLVLAADAIELPGGAKLTARTADISHTGCYIDTLNPIPEGSRVRLRLTHHDEVLEILGKVSYCAPRLGMGIAFTEITPEQKAKLDDWLFRPDEEF